MIANPGQLNFGLEKEGDLERRLVIPGRTEYPWATKGMLISWLGEFYTRNHIKKPKGLKKKTKKQLLGLYYGTLNYYGISEKRIVRIGYD